MRKSTERNSRETLKTEAFVNAISPLQPFTGLFKPRLFIFLFKLRFIYIYQIFFLTNILNLNKKYSFISNRSNRENPKTGNVHK